MVFRTLCASPAAASTSTISPRTSSPPLPRPASFPRRSPHHPPTSTASLSTSPRRVEAPPPRRPHTSLSPDDLRLGRPPPPPRPQRRATNRRARVSAAVEEHLQHSARSKEPSSSSIIRRAAATNRLPTRSTCPSEPYALICTAAAKSYAKPFSSVKHKKGERHAQSLTRKTCRNPQSIMQRSISTSASSAPSKPRPGHRSPPTSAARVASQLPARPPVTLTPTH